MCHHTLQYDRFTVHLHLQSVSPKTCGWIIEASLVCNLRYKSCLDLTLVLQHCYDSVVLSILIPHYIIYNKNDWLISMGYIVS